MTCHSVILIDRGWFVGDSLLQDILFEMCQLMFHRVGDSVISTDFISLRYLRAFNSTCQFCSFMGHIRAFLEYYKTSGHFWNFHKTSRAFLDFSLSRKRLADQTISQNDGCAESPAQFINPVWRDSYRQTKLKRMDRQDVSIARQIWAHVFWIMKMATWTFHSKWRQKEMLQVMDLYAHKSAIQTSTWKYNLSDKLG